MKLKLVSRYNDTSEKIELGTLQYNGEKYIWTPSKNREDSKYKFIHSSFFDVPGLSSEETMESDKLFWFFKDRISTNKKSIYFKEKLNRLGMDEYKEWDYIVATGLKNAIDYYELVRDDGEV